jgi:hypothetical protein
VVSYERVIRKAELFQYLTDSSVPLYVITIIEKHREIAAALSNPAAAEQLLAPIPVQTAASSMAKHSLRSMEKPNRMCCS